MRNVSTTAGGSKRIFVQNLRIVLRFVLQTEPAPLLAKGDWTTKRSVLKDLAEREGFEPSVQVLAVQRFSKCINFGGAQSYQVRTVDQRLENG